ncbi:pyridoxine 5'-phosphate synthase [Ostreibacterium oceani]|uniref:Pyridoxine 5'-phosphate synthase n=1 Tax=Ostreibacterium oceani TaxID=2654998 RepID=A0A6N7EYV4_9GAMM|nr:pyridoxine 5'-phosphate synthase [Ostreibacterium oceani]MPV86559.1 pyridoxine 5'-phosphate synthase [Ostreibacterium oceani]
MTALSVNLNKIALLRNARGRDYPNVVAMGEQAIEAGASGLTIHPRPDERHARYADIGLLKKLCEKHHVELNVEGYPNDDLLAYCIASQVEQVTLVPDAPNQITSDHGWSIHSHERMLTEAITTLKTNGIRVSLFMDADSTEIALAKTVGADRIELHTESYARSFERGAHERQIALFKDAFDRALDAGLSVNAGHDLTVDNLPYFLQHIPVAEVSIGHALTVEALQLGWQCVIARYVAICQNPMNYHRDCR